MNTKPRAMAQSAKAHRRHEILDAAETLFIGQPGRMASVAEVADCAGLAKGTVYLYFPSKEEMLLALHERHTEHFFTRFIALLGRSRSVDFDTILEVTREEFMKLPGCLPLTSRCFGLMERDLPAEAALAFKARVGARMAEAGAGLERHFPSLAPGAGAALLQHSLAIMVGLWQLIHPVERFGSAFERAELSMFMRDYDREVEVALRALWNGTIGAPAATVRAKRPRKGRPS